MAMTNNQLVIYNQISPYGDYEGYLRQIFSIPNLSEEEEKKLFKTLKIKNDLNAAYKIILAHLKLVVNIAKGYKNYGLPEEDLVSEGNIGLMKAVKNFNPNNKNRLYNYAIIWIKAEIQNFILNNWKIVKIGTTKALKKLFFSYRKLVLELKNAGVKDSEINQQIAKKLKVEKEEVKKTESFFANDEISLNEEYEDGNLKNEVVVYSNPENELVSNDLDEKRKKYLSMALSQLDERQKAIILNRFSENKKTHKELAKILKISSERVRQIENQSIDKIKSELNKLIKLDDLS